MKVTEKNKERLLEEYVSLIYMSTQIVNPAWNHHIKPTIEIIQRLPHKALESQYGSIRTIDSLALLMMSETYS